MGVPGLWDLLRPAAARTSLSTLAKSAFKTNRHGLRALTIGIDASLWIFHAQIPTAGENPFLRTIFFKICTLLQQPVLPVFVFDGPKKPSIKRGQRVAGQFGTADRRSLEFKALLNECGLEWWNAPGEAEAELAVMNRQGKIDAVLSDDVDALLFGATCLLRNNSPTLSGTQASTSAGSSKGDLKTYEVYRSSAIHSTWTSKANTSLATEEDCRMAMVFVALLAGGDYVPEGVEAFGPVIAFALANAGLSDTLSTFNNDPAQFLSSLPSLQARMVEELRTNASGHIGRRYPDRASKLSKRDPSDVFQISAIQSYLQPATSPISDLSAGWPGFGLGESSRSRGKARNAGRGDIEGMARVCEKYFEWGTRELVVKKFVSESVGVFGAEIMASARGKRIEADTASAERPSGPVSTVNEPASQSRMTTFFGVTASASSSSQPKRPAPGQSSSPSDSETPSYIIKIERSRPDPTNPELTELRILYDTKHLVERTQTAMKGTRIDPRILTPEERIALGMVELEPEEAGTEKGEKADKGQARVWIADWLVREAWPELVDDWENKQAAKATKSAGGKGRTKSAGTAKKGTAKAKGEDTTGFVKYFAATQALPSASRPRSRSPTKSRSNSSPITLLSDEEEEPVEPSRSVRTRKKTVGRDNPDMLVAPSRLPSASKSNSPSSPRLRQQRSPIRSRSPGLLRVKPKSSSSVIPRTRTTRSASGSNSKPIEILSSDEDNEASTKSVKPASPPKRTTRGSKAPILLNSSRQNTLSPIPSNTTAPKQKPPSRSKSSTTKQPSAQTRLNMPIISSQPTSSSPVFSSKPSKPITPPLMTELSSKPVSPSKSRSGVRASPSPIPAAEIKARAKPRRSYVLEKDWDEDGVEIMDCTRGGRLIVR